MRYLFIIWLFCLVAVNSSGQIKTVPNEFMSHNVRIQDDELIFTKDQLMQLDSILLVRSEHRIADVVILTIDDRHTNVENFDNYVRQEFISSASEHIDNNNRIVIAFSKKLRQMRIENGQNISSILSNENTKKIIDEQFIPKFKEEKYFEGTMNGLQAIFGYLESSTITVDYEDITSILSPFIFKKIRTFVLENGSAQTFRNFDYNNPSFNFTSLDLFLGPSINNSYVLNSFETEDYYEMTIRNNDGKSYQFVYVETEIKEQPFLHPKMQLGNVYWRDAVHKIPISEIQALLGQIEDEIAQKSVEYE